MDAEGHDISALEAKFTMTIKNSSSVDSDNIWINYTSTDEYDTNPIPAKRSWDSPKTASSYSDGLYLEAPVVPASQTLKLKWSVLFQTPFDVHYIIEIGTPSGSADPLGMPALNALGRDEYWTASRIC